LARAELFVGDSHVVKTQFFSLFNVFDGKDGQSVVPNGDKELGMEPGKVTYSFTEATLQLGSHE
jgi:hypothetical protein